MVGSETRAHADVPILSKQWNVRSCPRVGDLRVYSTCSRFSHSTREMSRPVIPILISPTSVPAREPKSKLRRNTNVPLSVAHPSPMRRSSTMMSLK